MNKSNQSTIYIIFAVVVLLVGVGAFYSGTVYQKAQGTSATVAGSNGFGAGANGSGAGFGARMGGGGIGAVTAVSDTSITVTERSRGSTATTPKTYAINSSTKITNNGSAVAASTIAVGDNVLVQTDTSDTATATSIMVNPSFGGGQAPAGNTQSTTDNSSDSTSQTSI